MICRSCFAHDASEAQVCDVCVAIRIALDGMKLDSINPDQTIRIEFDFGAAAQSLVQKLREATWRNDRN